MKVGIGLPGNVPGTKGDLILEWARRADAGPFSSLGTIDRLVYDNYEPLVMLSAAAGATERVRLLTCVLLAPLRNPGVLAKQAASLDAISGGRLTLGVGVGRRPDDYQAAPSVYGQRGRQMNRSLAMMRRIWNGDVVAEGVGAIGPAPGAARRPRSTNRRRHTPGRPPRGKVRRRLYRRRRQRRRSGAAIPDGG